MADLTADKVTKVSQWIEGDRGSRRVGVVIDAQIELSSQGGTSNTIPASAFGLSYIREATTCGKDGTPIAQVQFVPSFDGTLLYAVDIEEATDATRGDPVDVSGDYRVVIRGK